MEASNNVQTPLQYYDNSGAAHAVHKLAKPSKVQKIYGKREGNAHCSRTTITFLPARRTERSAFWKALVRNSHKVVRLGVNGIAPPCLNAIQADLAIVRVLQSKENNEDTDLIPRIQSSGQHI